MLEITIKGRPKTGKTLALAKIVQGLTELGFEVEFEDDEIKDTWGLANRLCVFEGKLNKKPVRVKTVQAKRGEIE